MEKKFFHYRNAFKSDHLASADIEELQENNKGKAILTLQKVQYFEGRSVAGRKMDRALVAFFAQDVKPMVINATNAKVLAKLIGSSNVNTWIDAPRWIRPCIKCGSTEERERGLYMCGKCRARAGYASD